MKELNKEINDFGAKSTGFRVPENYFSDFEARMNELIDQEEQVVVAPAPKVPLFAKMKPWLYMAASMVSFVLMFQSIIFLTKSDSEAGEDIALMEDAMYGSVSDYDIFESLYSDNMEFE